MQLHFEISFSSDFTYMHLLSYLMNMYLILYFQAEKRNLDMQELNRFLHYYTRFRNHENSYKLEEPLMKRAPAKMRKLACHSETKGMETALLWQKEASDIPSQSELRMFSYYT